EQMLKDGEPCIALSHQKRAGFNLIAGWLQQCFQLLTGSDGRPLAKVHALGMGLSGIPVLINSFALASVDSTTWAKQAAFGTIPLISYRSGQPDYTLPFRLFPITQRRRYGKRRHIADAADWEQDLINRYFKEVGIE